MQGIDHQMHQMQKVAGVASFCLRCVAGAPEGWWSRRAPLVCRAPFTGVLAGTTAADGLHIRCTSRMTDDDGAMTDCEGREEWDLQKRHSPTRAADPLEVIHARRRIRLGHLGPL